MSEETFFTYRRYRWFWLNCVLVVLLIAWYALHQPIGPPNGGTWYGYIVGGIATAGILYLMWYGIRKRSYRSHTTTLKGVLSGHVWLGIALTIIVPLHCGFQFNWNVHTMAYVLMVLVIASGLYGAVNYVHLAPDIESHRGGGSLKNLVEQIHISEQNVQALAKQKSDRFIALQQLIDPSFKPRYWSLLFTPTPKPPPAERVGALIAALPAAENEEAIKMVAIADRKRELVLQVQREVRVMAQLRLWLYLHLPLSLGLLAAVAIHIFAVFYYRG